ncbi:MAG: type II toxin-antitoxin system PemK/MazF family toxin [Candidatus Electryonea clarkiae]|nr:type II toxin-antitoxin system PemK/MazF family toxin [Candidatus Electryonea clarkiae]MDP8287422.1 type II toxin-antitoxin system PemK/MazF family toxin [Candidatus Electryonea clarkiae]
MAGITKVFRGQVIVVNLEPIIGSEQAGTARPCVVVSSNATNNILKTVIIAPLTDARHIKRSHIGAVLIQAGEGGLNKNSLLLAYQVRTISKERIMRILGSLSRDTMNDISESLKDVLYLTPYPDN